MIGKTSQNCTTSAASCAKDTRLARRQTPTGFGAFAAAATVQLASKEVVADDVFGSDKSAGSHHQKSAEAQRCDNDATLVAADCDLTSEDSPISCLELSFARLAIDASDASVPKPKSVHFARAKLDAPCSEPSTKMSQSRLRFGSELRKGVSSVARGKKRQRSADSSELILAAKRIRNGEGPSADVDKFNNFA